jgi:inorganic pyrophosphatase
VGLLKMRDEKGPDMKILTVPATDPRWRRLDDLADILPHLLREIENFFSIYKQLERKDVAVQGWGDKTEAWKVIDASKRAAP